MDNNRLDVLVRFHNLARFVELERCVFSVVCQSFSPTTIQLLLQRFSDEDLLTLQRKLSPLMSINPNCSVEFLNFTNAMPEDARSRLLNLGTQNSKGRFLAILDYDDAIYKDAYVKLVGRLRNTDAAIAFARVAVKYHEGFEDSLIVTGKEFKFKGANLVDLFIDNFCPIHSFVIDKLKLNPAALYFTELLSRLEDYDFLLRLVSKYPSDFHCIEDVIGDYYFKSDGSNTVQISSGDTGKDLDDWAKARSYIAVVKAKTVLSELVQRRMGMEQIIPGLTIGVLLQSHAKWVASRQS